MSDTIAAIATGSAVSAIGIIRMSGDAALSVADRVFTPLHGAAMSRRVDRTLILGELRAADGALLDICLCTVSRAPNTYTGEDTAELQCHGSPTVLREGLKAAFAAGARQAGPGEFTKRAFLNGRMDLTQAEAVIDLIEAETAECARNAAGQLGGALLRRVDGIYSGLLDMVGHYQAVVDYPDEGVEPMELEEYKSALDRASSELRRLLATYERGSVMRSGVPAAIVGRPNAGKSSLMNALLGYERAIVTSVAGTTRDTIEERVRLGGVLLRLTDTAGLRETDDTVERIGVDRAYMAAKSAKLVIAVFDGSEALTPEDKAAIGAALQSDKSVAVINKSDLPRRIDAPALESAGFDRVIAVSALDRTGIEALESTVSDLFPAPEAACDGEILTNSRQAQTASRALEAVDSARDALECGVTPDAVLSDAEIALKCLGEMTGKIVQDDVINNTFARFCVGK